MDLKTLSDRDLLTKIKRLVEKEREVLTWVLKHLQEIERRRLYSDLGYKTLFDYVMGELKYSESAAYRRISAMKLTREIPEMEQKVSSGKLSLSNITEAQSFFRRQNEEKGDKPLSKEEKVSVLESLEDKSAREAKRELFKLNPVAATPKEREKQVTPSSSQVTFVMDDELKGRLEEVRSLLGPKGAQLNYSQLFSEMAKLSSESLKAKKFGKKRVAKCEPINKSDGKNRDDTSLKIPKSKEQNSSNPRYISKANRYQVWMRDGGCCTRCGTRQNLNFDHVKPVAMGGESTEDNLRLLCFSCNQRAAMKSMGVDFMRSAAEK